MTLDIKIPDHLQVLVAEVTRAGGQVFLVGGSVRDAFLGASMKDWDLEVHAITLERLEAVLRTVGVVNTVGKAFSVIKVTVGGDEIDVAIPRRDSKSGAGHKGILVEGDPHLGLQAATRRRDLTINALMLALPSCEVVDLHGGLADISTRTLREVDPETFLEDPLRAVRVVQFASRMGFSPSESLKALCRQAADSGALAELPAERILTEMEKLFKGRNPALGFRIMEETGILAALFPEISFSEEKAQALQRNAERMDGAPERFISQMTTLLWGLSVADAERVLDRMNLHRMGTTNVRVLILKALEHGQVVPQTQAEVMVLAHRAQGAGLALGAHWAFTGESSFLGFAREAGVLHEGPKPLIQGRELIQLGVRPGPSMGTLLNQILEAQLRGHFSSQEAGLELARTLISG